MNQSMQLDESSTLVGEIDSATGMPVQNSDQAGDSASLRTESSSTDSSRNETPSFDWTSQDVPEAARDAYKAFQAEYTRKSQELADLKSKHQQSQTQFDELKGKAEFYDQLDRLVTQDAKKFETLQGILYDKPVSQVDESLKNDPVYERTVELQNRIHQLETALNNQINTLHQDKLNKTVDQELSNARKTYENMFGMTPSKDDMQQIVNFMKTKNVFDGEAAVSATFRSQYADHNRQNALREQKAKRGLDFNTTSMNSFKGVESSDPVSLREAFEKAINEYN